MSAAPGAVAPFRLPEAPRPPDAGDDRAAPGAQGFWHRGFPALVAVLALVVVGVARLGVAALLDSTDGQISSAVTDPSEPGFAAIAEPTPVLSVATVDEAGELSSVVLLALTGPTDGGALVLPPDSIVDDGTAAPTVLRAAMRAGGPDELTVALDRMLGFDSGELVVLGPDDWAVQVAPLAPLEVTFVDDVVVDDDGRARVRWEAGPQRLDADEVAEALLATTPGESDLVHMGRVEQVWVGWLAAIAAGGDDAVVGERDVGLGRFLLGLASDAAAVTTPPMVVAGLPDGGGELFALDAGADALVRSLVPFPRSGFEGQRLRSRVLDGTGTDGLALGVAERLVGAGAEITIIGNASSFDVTTTQLVFHREEDRAAVEALREELGVGELVLVEEAEVAVDVTVVLGSDLEGARG